MFKGEITSGNLNEMDIRIHPSDDPKNNNLQVINVFDRKDETIARAVARFKRVPGSSEYSYIRFLLPDLTEKDMSLISVYVEAKIKAASS